MVIWKLQEKFTGGGITLNNVNILDIIYPVGIIVEFANDTNPNNIMVGQVWEQWGQGCVVVGAGTNTDKMVILVH